MRRLVTICLTAALLFGTAALVTAGPASANTPVLVRGTMINGVDNTGAAIPATGAWVQVYTLDPTDAPLDPTGVGTPMTPVGSTHVASDGTWSVRTNPTGTMNALAAQNDGWVNFMAVMIYHKHGNAYEQAKTFTRLLPGFTTSATDTRADTTTYGVDQGENMATPIDLTDASTAAVADSPGAQPDVSIPPNCSRIGTVASDHNGNGPINEVHAVGDMAGSASYAKTSFADSNIESGIQWSYPPGPFQFSGSVHVGNSSSNSGTTGATEFGGVGHGGDTGAVMRGWFWMHKDKYACITLGDPATYLYAWTAQMWTGNERLDDNFPLAYDHQCWAYPSDYQFHFSPGGVHWHQSDTSQTWSQGFSALGIGWDIRSGFSTSVTKEWHMGSSTASDQQWLCGTNNAPLLATRTFSGWH
jgi:hypothetical protein